MHIQPAVLSESTSEVHQPSAARPTWPHTTGCSSPASAHSCRVYQNSAELASKAFLTVPPPFHFSCALRRHLSSQKTHRLEQRTLNEQAQDRGMSPDLATLHGVPSSKLRSRLSMLRSSWGFT